MNTALERYIKREAVKKFSAHIKSINDIINDYFFRNSDFRLRHDSWSEVTNAVNEVLSKNDKDILRILEESILKEILQDLNKVRDIFKEEE